MPNTLAHIGVQVPLTKFGLGTAPVQWIVLGCLLPDIPWILQRILRMLPMIDPVTVRMYVVFQASFFSCCILACGLALLTRKRILIFSLLTGNALIHLLIDASQQKWGNGINLLLPFSYHTTNFGFFWPESPLTHMMTALGVLICILYWPKPVTRQQLFLKKPDSKGLLGATGMLLIYLILPLFFIKPGYEADLHYAKTISGTGNKTGLWVEIDRGVYNHATQTISSFAASAIPVTNPPPVEGKTLSIQGIYDENNTIVISNFHEHRGFRDYGSYAGLLWILTLWGTSFWQRQKYLKDTRKHDETG